jgi:hypothetical protein
MIVPANPEARSHSPHRHIDTEQTLQMSISLNSVKVGFMMRQTFGVAAALVALLLIAALLFSGAMNRPAAARIDKIREVRAYADVLVSRHTPRLMRRQNEPIEEPFDVYRDAQFRMIKSPFVLTRALGSIGEL